MTKSSNEYLDGAINLMQEFLATSLEAQNNLQGKMDEYIAQDIADAEIALKQLGELKLQASGSVFDLRPQVDEIIKTFNLQFG